MEEAPEAAADSEDMNLADEREHEDEEPEDEEPEDLGEIEEIEKIEDLEEIEEIEDLEDDEALDADGMTDEDLGDESHFQGDGGDDAASDAEATDAHPRKAPAEGADPDVDDDDLLADEVEASLDVILAERLRGEDPEEEDLEEDEDDAPNQLATVIPVRQPNEFLCQSCFLLKPPGQLADRDHQLCRDCA